jgi:RND family efflux transporter MFP subunit
VEAFESANLAPKLSGYLKNLNVDIGDAVRRGQVLAEVDAPETVAERCKAEAMVERASARLATAKAAVMVARASLAAEKAKADAAGASVQTADARLQYQGKSTRRLRELASRNAVERNLIDEAESRLEAAKSDLASARAQEVTAKASIQEASAKLVAAESDVREAEADLHVAQADLGKALAVAESARIVAPWDGVVTGRGYDVGDYVRSGDAGGPAPLLTLVKTGIMRVVVHVPDMDAPYLNKGDRATVRFDSLRGRVYHVIIARTALAVDPADRTVRAEIDLRNEDGRLRPGQYGRVTINLQDRGKILSIPASALIEQAADGAAACYRIVDGRAVRTRIKVGEDNGDRVEVLEGLKEGDLVISDPAPGLADGQRISVKQGTGGK